MRSSLPANDHHDGFGAPTGLPATIEEFDRLEGDHRFSDSYQERKQALLSAYAVAGGAEGEGAPASQAPEEAAGTRMRKLSWKVALALAAVLVALPVCAWAVIDHSGFFGGAFGSSARTSVEAHDETQAYEGGKSVTIAYPSREYVEADTKEAEQLLGPYVSTEAVPVTIGDHVLTVLSAVRDADTMVVHYTLERPGGVTALEWSDLTNQGKGARQAHDPYYWQFVGGIDEGRKAEGIASWESSAPPDDPAERTAYELGKQAAFDDLTYNNYAGSLTLVDPERSTADKLYCYDYLTFTDTPEQGAPITLQVSKQTPVEERPADWWGTTCDTEQIVEVPVEDVVPARTLAAEGVGRLSVSPLSLRFDHTGEGDVVSEELARARYEAEKGQLGAVPFDEYLASCRSECDVDAIRQITVRYQDGTTYTVYDAASNLDNTAYVLGREDRQTVWMFNRLVNPEAIESITVNDVTFA